MLKCHFFLLWFKYFTLNKKIIRYSQHISCSNKRLGPGSVCLLTFCIGSFIKSICFSFPLLPAPSTKAPPANHLLQITATGPYLHRLPTPWLPTNPYPPPQQAEGHISIMPLLTPWSQWQGCLSLHLRYMVKGLLTSSRPLDTLAQPL